MSQSSRSKRIYVDSRWVGDHGIGRFADEVMNRLKLFGQLDSTLKPTDTFDVFYLTYKVLRNRYDVWFSPGYNAPLFGFKRYVFTVHDLNHIDTAANSNILKHLYYQIIMRRACRGVARVLTVSEFSKRRIVEWSGVDPSHVVNVGNGVSAEFSFSVDSYNPGYPYLLCIGNRKRHKNEVRLLKAFAAAAIDSKIHLLFSGPSSNELQALAHQLGVSDRILFLDHIEQSELPKVYRGAISLVFPSLYEGFGLPVIESMACGTPVITSNVTALPEVAGNAAILVDPMNVTLIADAIEHIVCDMSLRADLIRKGYERVKAFSWDSVADKVQAVLNEVATE